MSAGARQGGHFGALCGPPDQQAQVGGLEVPAGGCATGGGGLRTGSRRL